MKIETLKTLIKREYKDSKTMLEFKKRTLKLIDLYQLDIEYGEEPTITYPWETIGTGPYYGDTNINSSVAPSTVTTKKVESSLT